MQKRILNYRESYKLDGDSQNISSNFYPVATAIAIRQNNGQKIRQVTVMNDRSQAGSAGLTPGQIEFIHNRRLIVDDDRGVEEPLNETDSEGFGLRVSAKYWVDIFEVEANRPHDMWSNDFVFPIQRQHQLKVDQPPQFFFAFNFKQDSKMALRPTPQLVEFQNFWNGKLVLFPLAKNEILARFENLGDKFDFVNCDFFNKHEFCAADHHQTIVVNVEQFARQLYSEVNGQTAAPWLEIQELGLSAN